MPEKNKGGRQYRPPKECKEFGLVLRSYRKRSGLSLTQVGEMLGCKESSVAKLEAGEGFSGSFSKNVPQVYHLTEKDARRWNELRQMMIGRNKQRSCMKPAEARGNYKKGSLAERASNFGRLLAMKRYEMGLSQEKFAKAKNISVSYIRFAETGIRFSSWQAEKVPEAYALSPEEAAQFKVLCEEAKACVNTGWSYKNCKGALYIYTDGSKFELPVYVSVSLSQLAMLVGVTPSYISKALSDHYRFGYNTRFRTTLEPISDDDAIEEQRIKDYIEKRYGVCPP